ncbi:MAG: lactate utilization protein [Flavipsychrobacter sp.]|nr:lactate utilization protein [Flavipsychrobacter sp.]
MNFSSLFIFTFEPMQTFKTSKARENILSKIRKGLGGQPLPMPFPDVEKNMGNIYPVVSAPEEVFAEAFIKLGGKFIFCENEQELLYNINILHENRGWDQLLCADQHLLKLFQNNKMNIVEPADPKAESADACITGCEMLVARTGTIMLTSKQNMGRVAPVYYPVHLVFAYANQIVPDIEDGFAALKKKYGTDLPSMINLTTGPSRTADIEKTLVVGVHGPGEVFCFFINADM